MSNEKIVSIAYLTRLLGRHPFFTDPKFPKGMPPEEVVRRLSNKSLKTTPTLHPHHEHPIHEESSE